MRRIDQLHGEILQWPGRSLSHQSALVVFASCLCIPWASAKVIGSVIVRVGHQSIVFRLMKSLRISNVTADVRFARGDLRPDYSKQQVGVGWNDVVHTV